MDAGTLTPRDWPRPTGRRIAPLQRALFLAAALAGGIAAVALGTGGAAAQQKPSFTSAQTALAGGLGAYQAGQRNTAISALSEAVARGDASERFVAEFYLARIYSEDVAGGADHTKAFVLFRKLADENVTVDPETSQRAPFVAKALIALAGYMRSGLKEIDLAPNPARAADYLHHAAVFFGDRDAQYELARTYLDDDRRSDDVRRGLHYLAALTEESHAPAQALLGELFWLGRHVKKDERRALALITMAAEGAPSHERIWIEDVYATIYCASAPSAREQAGLLAARWRTMFARPHRDAAAGTAAAGRDLLPERQCANGEKVALGVPSRPEPTAAQPPGLGLLTSASPPAGFRAAGFIEAPAAKK